MKPAAVLLAAVAVVAPFVACVDLFHDTDTLIAPAHGDGAAPDGGPDAAVGPLCVDSADAAFETAKSACSWLGACANPLGVNEPGECLVQALRAYDCGFDPANAPRAERNTFWRCLQAAANARSCDEVVKCTSPAGVGTCNPQTSDGFVCGSPKPSEVAHYTRVLCQAGEGGLGGNYENCAAAGGSCIPEHARCSTFARDDLGASCTRTECEGDTLSVCDLDRDGGAEAGVEVARLDCTQGGAGRCGSGRDASTPACVAGPATACDQDGPVACVGSAARRCRNGVLELVDCARAGLTCAPAGSDVTYQACRAPGDAAACVPGCLGNDVTACLQGRPVTLDCDAQRLGRCQEKEGPNEKGFACGKPL